MSLTITSEGVGMLVGVGITAFVFVRREAQQRRTLARIFSRHQQDSPTLAALQEMLAAFNRESPARMFTAERRANIPFRGQSVSIVHGHAGCHGPGKCGSRWAVTKQLYAVGDSGQSEWLKQNPDVFTPAVMGSACSLFQIRLRGLLTDPA